MHFVTDDQHPCRIIEKLLEPLVPGSHLTLSHLITEDPDNVKRVDAIYRTESISLKARSFQGIAQFFQGLQVCDPGIAPTTGWHPDDPMTVHDEPAVYAGIALKP